MSIEPQPPIKRFLDVPDVVGAVFEQLDPANRKAFFESHPHVAHAGPVLAQSELRIELSPTISLEDQWQRVLDLTRSQPVRCLIISAPNKKQLLDFMRCVLPEGSQERKLRVLQGTGEVRLQVLVEMKRGGATVLQALLMNWHEEQQQGIEDAASVQLVLDLCGHELHVTDGNLEPPSCCTLRNGALQLDYTCRVRVAGVRVRFENLKVVGVWGQDALVEVVGGGSLEMEGCHVEGGDFGAAVRVEGGSSLLGLRTILHSRMNGLVIRGGSKAVLEQCLVRDNGECGVLVSGKSSLSAVHCHIDQNVCTNINLINSSARLEHVTSNCSGDGCGWGLDGQSSMHCVHSESSGNNASGASVTRGGRLKLVSCQIEGNFQYGLDMICASLVAEDSCVKNNNFYNVYQDFHSNSTISADCDLGGQMVMTFCSDGIPFEEDLEAVI